MNPERLQVLNANKREMFDAMRAYQESERGHKTDAMALLGVLLVAAGAAFGALVLPEKPVPYVPADTPPTEQADNIGQGLGYNYTKRILRSIGITLSALSWLAFLFVALAVCSGARTCVPQQAAALTASPASPGGR